MMSKTAAAALAGILWCSGPAGAALAAGDGTQMGGAKTPADKAFARSMRTMMTSMAAVPTGDTDQDFVTMMLPHHQGAVDMAKVELQYGKDPFLIQLAKEIVAAQDKEIAEMKDWQRKHSR